MNTGKLSLNQRNILNLFDKEEFLSVGKISKFLKIPRPTVKQSLNRLLEYNMVSRQGTGKGSFYSRKDENVILDTLGNKLVMIYQGKEAFTNLFNEIAAKLQKDDFYWSFAFKNEYYESEVREFFINFHHRLTKKGVKDKTIVHQSVKEVIKKTYQNVVDLEIRFSKQEVPFGMSILKDRVVNLIWGEKPIAIAIFAPQVVKRYQDFFKSSWQKSKISQ